MTFFLFISDTYILYYWLTIKAKQNAVFTAIHPATYRGGGLLAHGVLNDTYHDRVEYHQ